MPENDPPTLSTSVPPSADFSTRAVHQGAFIDTIYGSVVPPIYTSSTFRWNDPLEVPEIDYARCKNPTRHALQELLASLEGGQAAIATNSGMSAIHTVLLLLSASDHVVCGFDAYAGTYRLFTSVLSRLGIEFTFVDMADPAEVQAAITDRTRLVWVETPSNPLMQLTNIAAIAELTSALPDCLLAVDNTFLSSAFQRPLELGADLVVHATTKYLSGHSDVIGGAVVARQSEVGSRLQSLVTAIGSGQSAFDAYLVQRGIRSLVPRMQHHQTNALALATWLESHPSVSRVFYPGLPSHPQFQLAQKQQSGPGGMLSFIVDPSRTDACEVARRVRVFQLAVSLGGTESLLEIPWHMSHHSLSEDERTSMGLSPQLIRLSPGLESTNDLIQDLQQALN
ncbi:MAG: trans-sulfuration enzyme family protein [Puniceicoccaceae bacterium]